jgi:hypothetical protein
MAKLPPLNANFPWARAGMAGVEDLNNHPLRQLPLESVSTSPASIPTDSTILLILLSKHLHQ